MIDSTSLACFAAVARERSVNRAARRLRASQPAVSRRIRQLEHDVGARLFDRSSTGVVLTAAGRALLRYSDEIQRLTNEAHAVVRQFAGERQRLVRIGFHPAASAVLIPLLRRLHEEYPTLNVEPREASPGELLKALDAGEIDIALPGYTRPAAESRFEELRIPSPTLSVVFPLNHRFARRRRVRLTELKHEHFIAPDDRLFPGCRELLVTLCRAAGFRPSITRTAESLTAAVAQVIAGRGVAVIPESTIPSSVQEAVCLVPSDARSDWHALWSGSNGNPYLPYVVEILRNPAARVSRSARPRSPR